MRFHSGHSMRQLFLSTVYWLNWNLKGWFLWMVENWRTQSKTPRTRMRTNNNLNPHVTLGRESDLRHNKGRWVLTPLCHPPPPKFPLSRFSISKGVLQDNLVLLTVFPDCFSYFSSSFCQKMYHYCKEKLPSDHCWNRKGLHYMWIAPRPDQAAPDWLGSYHVGMELPILLQPFQYGLFNQPINSLYPHIIILILKTVLYTFPKVLTNRICLTIKSFFSWWLFPLFS